MSDSFFDSVRKVIDDYYIYIPNINSSEYMRFIAESDGYIIKNVSQKDRAINIFIDVRSTTAYTDLQSIYLPAGIFDSDWFKRFPYEINDEQTLTSLSMVIRNGFMLHEAAHIAKTPKPSPSFIDDSRAEIFAQSNGRFDLPKNEEKSFRILDNIVEDVFVNDFIFRKFPNKSIFLKLTNYFLFGKKSANSCWENFLSSPDLMKALIVLTNFSNPSVSIIDEEWYKFFETEMDYLNKATKQFQNRGELSVQIYISLKEKLEELKNEEQQENSDDSDDSDNGDNDSNSSNGDGDGGDADEQNDGEQNDGEGSGSIADDENLVDGVFSETITDAEELLKNNKLLDDYIDANKANESEKAEQKISLDAQLSLNEEDTVPVIFEDVLNGRYMSEVDETLLPNRKFFKLGTYLRTFRELKSYKGILRNRGRSLTKRFLSRIVVDDKILHRNDGQKKQKGKPEVILLLDVSGSTYGEFYNENTGKEELLIDAIIEASMGAFMSFREAKIPCSVYAHTTGHGGSLVYSVASFNMPLVDVKKLTTTPNWKYRFQSIKTCDSSCNADGTAIKFVADRFTNGNNSKLLIVLSDGRPTLAPRGFSYDGDMRRTSAYAMMMVEEARKKNVKVLSFSLVENVVMNNDAIYGKDFNIRAFGGNLDKQMQKVVRMIGVE